MLPHDVYCEHLWQITVNRTVIIVSAYCNGHGNCIFDCLQSGAYNQSGNSICSATDLAPRQT